MESHVCAHVHVRARADTHITIIPKHVSGPCGCPVKLQERISKGHGKSQGTPIIT